MASSRWNRMEAKEAKRDGANVVPNSGRGNVKGDAKMGIWLVDYKFTSKSFSLSLQNWLKHKRDAWKEDQRDPLVKVVFEDGTKVAIIPWEMFEELGNGFNL
jgi:hypothetical protein